MSRSATIGEICALLGITPAAVRDLTSKGIVKRLSRGAYDIDVSVPAYCAHLRETASGRGGELASERARLAREQADQVAMRNRLARQELVPVIEVEREWSLTLRGVRDGVLAVPSRVQQRLPHLTAHDVAEIDHELRAALSELADDAGTNPPPHGESA